MNNAMIVSLFIGIHAYLAIVANYHTAVSDSYSRQQKRLQILLAWSVPVLGSLLIILVALSDREHVRTIMTSSRLPSPLLRIVMLTAFSGSIGLTGYEAGSSDFGSSSWGGYDGGGDGGGGDGGGGDG
jgi:hypothetical protein